MLHFNSLEECLATLDEIWTSGQSFDAPLIYIATDILNALIKACDNLDGLYPVFGSIDFMYNFIFKSRDSEKLLEYLRKLAKTVVEINSKMITDDVDRNLQKIVEYLEKNFCDPNISLTIMSRDIHLSVSYISTLLKKKLNTSFVKMLTNLRMNRAKLLLKDQNLKIVDVAEQLGFNNSYYFSHSFRKHTGLSPREYKSI
jgi:two-component system response regulator YesN